MRNERLAIGSTYSKSSEVCWEGTCARPIANENTDLIVEGDVGIRTFNPQAALDVIGISKTDGLLLSPQNNVPSPVEGLLYYNSPDSTIYFYKNSQWRKLVFLEEELIGRTTLSVNYQITSVNAWRRVGYTGVSTSGLIINAKTPQTGLYKIEWGGNVYIDAKDGRKVVIGIYYGGACLGTFTYEDEDGEKNGTPSVHDISGSALVILGRNKNYQVRMNAYVNGYSSTVSALAESGMWIEQQLVLPF